MHPEYFLQEARGTTGNEVVIVIVRLCKHGNGFKAVTLHFDYIPWSDANTQTSYLRHGLHNPSDSIKTSQNLLQATEFSSHYLFLDIT